MHILNPQLLARHSDALYGNSKLALYTDIHKLKDRVNEDLDCLVEVPVFTLVTKGRINITMDSEECHLERGDFFSCHPNNIIRRSMASMDFESLTMCMSVDYCLELFDLAGLSWTYRAMVQSHEVFHLDDAQIEAFRNMFHFLMFEIQAPDSPNKGRCIEYALLSLLFQLFDMREKAVSSLPLQTYTAQENILQRFIKLLKDSNPITNPGAGYLSVKEYAEKLCVTSKYFSTTCKKQTGKTAGQIIDEEIMNSAKLLLHDNTKSIKQVSDLLGFANQSHFGSYFSRKMGISPQRFRGLRGQAPVKDCAARCCGN